MGRKLLLGAFLSQSTKGLLDVGEIRDQQAHLLLYPSLDQVSLWLSDEELFTLN